MTRSTGYFLTQLVSYAVGAFAFKQGILWLFTITALALLAASAKGQKAQ